MIANTLVTLSEELVNRIEMRPKQDFLKFAQEQYERAEASLKAAHTALTSVSDVEGVVDPNASVVVSNVEIMRACLGSVMPDYRRSRTAGSTICALTPGRAIGDRAPD